MTKLKRNLIVGLCAAVLAVGVWYGISRAHDYQSQQSAEIVMPERLGKDPSAEQIPELDALIGMATLFGSEGLPPNMTDRQIIEHFQARRKGWEFYEIIDYKGFLFLTLKMPLGTEFARQQKPGALFNLMNVFVVNKKTGKVWPRMLARC